MKWVAAGLGLSGIACAAFSGLNQAKTTTLVITGDIAGYLSPCGCTTPMTGGIARQATLIHRLSGTSDVVLVSNGAMTGGTGRQNEMKAATLAQTFGALNAAAINLAPEDAKLGLGSIQTVQNLSNDKLVSGSIEPLRALPIRPFIESHGLLIGGASMRPTNIARPMGTQPISAADAIRKLLDEAKEGSSVPVLLLDGDEADAKTIANRFQDLPLIVYRSASNSPPQPLRVGASLLVTPGEFGKSVVSLTFDGQKFSAYQVISLGPAYEDDPQIERFLSAYLRNVDKSDLLASWPRRPTAAFTGSAACGKCHTKDYRIWANTNHAKGLASLEVDGHGRDPDCVSCHVVGLDSTHGYRSRAKTPALADVGCESCHGPGAEHSFKPLVRKMPKVGLGMCVTCHKSDRSPEFNSLKYWRRIMHR